MKDSQTAAKTTKPTIKGHVMLSYQWKYKPLVILIKDLLKSAGLQVWMDIEQMCELKF